MADYQQQRNRDHSFEQDLLRSAPDQDAVLHVLATACNKWGVDATAAWAAALVRQAVLGRLRAYRGTGPYIPIDLARTSLDEAAQDYELFMEPTEATFARLNEIGSEASSARGS